MRKLARIGVLGTVPTALLVAGSLACGGSGETDDRNEPGGDTELEPDGWAEHALGTVAVQTDESRLWVVNQGQTFVDSNEDGYPELAERKAWLVSIAVDGTALTPSNVIDVSGGSDRRISFPTLDRAVYFEQIGYHTERMVRLDTLTATPTLERQVSGFFTGARTSPSRRFILANDQLDGAWRVAMVDSSSLETAIVPQDGFMPQGVWNKQSDRLWTVTMGLDPAWARVKRLRVDDLDVYETEYDLYLDGFGCDPKFDYSWVAVSEDDRWAVFPLWQGQDRRLTIVDQLDGTHRTIPGSGPVGFLPNGSRVVSWDWVDGGSEDPAALLLTDPVTLVTETVPLPIGITYPEWYTVPNGSWVVVTGELGAMQVVLYDWWTGETTSIAAPTTIALQEFVRRSPDQLWIVSNLDLFRLDLGDATLDLMTVPGYDVRHVNVLPSRDALVLTESAGGDVGVFGMGSLLLEASLTLPDPLP